MPKRKDPEWGEATRGFEPLMRVLQTLALPLGHVADTVVYGVLILRDGQEIVNLCSAGSF